MLMRFDENTMLFGSDATPRIVAMYLYRHAVPARRISGRLGRATLG